MQGRLQTPRALSGCVSFSSGCAVGQHVRLHGSVCRRGRDLGNVSGRGDGSTPGSYMERTSLFSENSRGPLIKFEAWAVVSFSHWQWHENSGVRFQCRTAGLGPKIMLPD